MKAKRIVSILLTGSMLLSLLPVSALAAAPVFDAPAQTTAKKAAPLVQEADASRSTEEEASTRSSRDLDAENGHSESITIDLNADGKPTSEGDYDHWYYYANSTALRLYDGTFTLQPSSEPGAVSALQPNLDIGGAAEFKDGTVGGGTDNHGTISGGTFQGTVTNYQTISGGTFQGPVYNDETISGGTFPGYVKNQGTISGGTFPGTVENLGTISGGYFVTKPTMPEGSGTGFTTVSDQSCRAFHVPVNGDWSEKGYSSLYVPSGSSEQPNTITVKTNTKLLYYLADGERFPVLDSDSDSYIYQIPVQSFEKIVLVTEEPSAPPTDDPGELDPAFSSGAAALGVVLGTAGLGYVAYINGTSLYLHYALPGGFIPSTRQELANVLWTTAGKPDPVSTALYTDIPADAIEQQKAARWCVEQGLLSDYGATFGPDTTVTNARIIRAWNSLKKVPVPITN